MNRSLKYSLFLSIMILLAFTGYALTKPSQTNTPTQPPIDEKEFVGQVTALAGTVTTQNDEKLHQGSMIKSGTTLSTAANSKVALTMIDGATIILGANSTLKISEYRYQQQATDNSVMMQLMHGIFRTVSGAIGKNDTDNYQMTTPCLLTIGIQGTDYQVNFNDNKEFISAHKGVITVEKESLFGAAKTALLGDQQQNRYIRVKKPAKGTRAIGSAWETYSEQNKPDDLPPALQL